MTGSGFAAAIRAEEHDLPIIRATGFAEPPPERNEICPGCRSGFSSTNRRMRSRSPLHFDPGDPGWLWKLPKLTATATSAEKRTPARTTPSCDRLLSSRALRYGFALGCRPGAHSSTLLHLFGLHVGALGTPRQLGLTHFPVNHGCLALQAAARRQLRKRTR